jgi:Putative lumazine-binding
MNKLIVTAGLLCCAGPLAGQTAADSAGIRQAALDYIEGWYSADAARMERALHPELAKRQVQTDQNGRSRLIQMTAMTLVQGTRAGGGTSIPATERKTEVKILDIYQGAAMARVDAGGWIDYMHLARWNGQWKIVNVLWENAPSRSAR